MRLRATGIQRNGPAVSGDRIVDAPAAAIESPQHRLRRPHARVAVQQPVHERLGGAKITGIDEGEAELDQRFGVVGPKLDCAGKACDCVLQLSAMALAGAEAAIAVRELRRGLDRAGADREGDIRPPRLDCQTPVRA